MSEECYSEVIDFWSYFYIEFIKGDVTVHWCLFTDSKQWCGTYVESRYYCYVTLLQGRHKLLDNSFNNSESLPETIEPEHHNPVTDTNDAQSKQWRAFPYLEI